MTHPRLEASREKLVSSLASDVDLLLSNAFAAGRREGLDEAERLLREASSNNITLPVEVRKIFSNAADQLARLN